MTKFLRNKMSEFDLHVRSVVDILNNILGFNGKNVYINDITASPVTGGKQIYLKKRGEMKTKSSTKD